MSRWRDGLGATMRGLAAGADRPGPTVPWSDQGVGVAADEIGPQDEVVLGLALARILRATPALRVDVIVAAAMSAFLAVETAWSSLDAQGSRAFMAPALWESHRSRMELYATHGRRNALDALRVRRAAIVAADAGPPARVTVRIEASSADYDVDPQGRLLRGDRSVFDWAEDWVIEQRVPDPGEVPRCLNCGAPLNTDARGLCTSCHAPLLADGAWVVIAAQRLEDERSRRDAILGIQPPDAGIGGIAPAPLILPSARSRHAAPAHDPQALAVLAAAGGRIDPAVLVTHVTAAFSALRAAWAAMSIDPAAPYLAAGAATELGAGIEALHNRGLRRVADVPLVEAVRIDHAADSDGLLTLQCSVTATLVDADVDGTGALVRGTRELQDVSCALQLRRHAGARSPQSGVVMQRCDRCGAPTGAAVLGLCDHCRGAVAAGGGEWAIVEVGPLQPAGALAVVTGVERPVVDLGLDLCAPLRAADPGLDAYDIIASCRDLFWRVEAAMGRLDLDPCAALLEPALLTDLKGHAAALRAARHHLVLGYLDIRLVRIVAASVEDAAEVVTLRITAEAEDTERDDSTGAAVGGSGRLHRWDEDWTLRRPGPGGSWRLAAIQPVAVPAP